MTCINFFTSFYEKHVFKIHFDFFLRYKVKNEIQCPDIIMKKKRLIKIINQIKHFAIIFYNFLIKQ